MREGFRGSGEIVVVVFSFGLRCFVLGWWAYVVMLWWMVWRDSRAPLRRNENVGAGSMCCVARTGLAECCAVSLEVGLERMRLLGEQRWNWMWCLKRRKAERQR